MWGPAAGFEATLQPGRLVRMSPRSDAWPGKILSEHLQTAELPGAEQHSDIAFEEAATGMAFVDFEGGFLAVNPALCELVGRAEQDLLGRTWQSITHPQDVEPGQHEMVKAIADEKRTFRLAKRYIRPDGRMVWVLLSVSLIRNALGDPICLFTQAVDITEQRRAEEELSRLASVVEFSDDAIMSEDLKGTVLSWNHAAERMYGYTADQMIGRSVHTIVPPGRQQEVEQLLEGIRRGESVRNVETVRLRKDGSAIDVSITVSPIRDPWGVPVAASSIARDFREQKRLAAELERTMVALESAADEAHNSEARTRSFLCTAAHHLRNPVAGVRACAETLLRGADPSGRERLLVEIARETSRASRLVDGLLRMARLEAGERLTFQSQNIVAVCQDEVERAKSFAPHLEIVMTAEEAIVFQLDAEAVAEIVGNVLGNACRHARRCIQMSIGRTDSGAFVHVNDDGPGLPEGGGQEAFKPFMVLDGKCGAGLGLPVSRALARAHGGDLNYDNRRFVLRIDEGFGQGEGSRIS